ncbi:cation transporter [Paracoccus suum]|uniref:Cation transporter n=1 Tax=Paracoccus suum TaxID=2259340 RepID=A0A344PGI3_9RHOB|nr:cation diffusion facilitator family transporter [Paracoccus suum]AXC48488.1 cation transporter [Paracoccus suum]
MSGPRTRHGHDAGDGHEGHGHDGHPHGASGHDARAEPGPGYAHVGDAHGTGCARDGHTHGSATGGDPHDHGHGHGHDHHGHSHAPRVTAANERRLAIILALTASYALVQAIGGWLSGSLALVADAGHMISDSAALLLALMAYRLAARRADGRRTYGFHRVRVLAALANGVALLVLVAWIAWEAIARLRHPAEVMAGPMLAVAVVGLIVNIIGAVVLSRGEGHDANLRGAYLHVLGDLLGSVGAIAAAIGIMLTGRLWLDPALSVLVAVLVLRSAWGLVRDAIDVLLQATPRGVDAASAEAEVATLGGVAEAGHFHAWTLTDEQSIATIHVCPDGSVDPLQLPQIVTAHLRQRYSIDHVTVQVDPPGRIAAVDH